MLVEIKENLSKVIKKKYKLDVTASVEAKLFDKIADYSTPVAFQLAKELKKNPMQLAQELCAFLAEEKIEGIEKIEAVNGYLNFTVASHALIKSIDEGVKSKHFGNSTEHKGESVVVEYSCPNVGKPMHVGHLRATIYGDSVKHLLASQGYKTIAMNYLGDSGTQVAKLIYALDHYKDLPKPTDEKKIVQYYIKVSAEEEKIPDVKEKVRSILEKIESGDKGIQAKLREVRDISMNAFNRVYATLGVEYDEVVGESQFIAGSKLLVKECEKKGLVKKDKDGTYILELESRGLNNTVLMRSNGTTLYLTRDLALADYKYEKYKADFSFYCTASEQNLHFKQLFLTMKLLGRSYADNLKHVGFGLVSSTEGKLSTRAGNVIFLEDVLEEVCDIAALEAKTRNANVDAKTASAIGLGSIKFAFLKVTPEKNIVFNPKEAVSFEGDTGAYLQYAYVRCTSILEKSDEKPKATSVELNEYERELAKALNAFPSVVSQAAKGYAPHVLCVYLLKLAATYSTFYAQCSVNNAPSKESKQVRLLLVKATAVAIKNGLAILGINCPEKM